MAEIATCAGCNSEAELPLNPADSTQVIREPRNWAVVTIHPTDKPIRSVRLCGYCAMMAFGHLDWARVIIVGKKLVNA